MASLEFIGPLLLPIVVALLAAAIASADRDWGVLRYLYVAPVTRARLLAAKLAAAAHHHRDRGGLRAGRRAHRRPGRLRLAPVPPHRRARPDHRRRARPQCRRPAATCCVHARHGSHRLHPRPAAAPRRRGGRRRRRLRRRGEHPQRPARAARGRGDPAGPLLAGLAGTVHPRRPTHLGIGIVVQGAWIAVCTGVCLLVLRRRDPAA